MPSSVGLQRVTQQQSGEGERTGQVLVGQAAAVEASLELRQRRLEGVAALRRRQRAAQLLCALWVQHLLVTGRLSGHSRTRDKRAIKET